MKYIVLHISHNLPVGVGEPCESWSDAVSKGVDKAYLQYSNSKDIIRKNLEHFSRYEMPDKSTICIVGIKQ